uniref:SAM pointed domain containing ETS transcription factor n=1 Tax=Neogobius melanostomus TaxID=47308 RepID=A0A8C6WYA1_9GOBI
MEPFKWFAILSWGTFISLFITLDQSEADGLEQMQTMVLGEVLKDVDTACKLLNISPDPLGWSSLQVQKWLLWTEHMYCLPRVSMLFQGLSGQDLCSLSEAQFRQHSAQFGDMLYAHLDVWRSGTWKNDVTTNQVYFSNLKMFNDLLFPYSCVYEGPVFFADVVCGYHNQPIHLWQFLRELLLRPHNYSHCIRWLNKEMGIFKIEDSAHVARLWGMRKNRPAMNYDKLSRSIRQYYKKGIIRKPEESRRLVYQFMHPI